MTRTEENLITAEKFFRASLRAMIKAIDAAKEEFPESPDGSILGGIFTDLGQASCIIAKGIIDAKSLVKS